MVSKKISVSLSVGHDGATMSLTMTDSSSVTVSLPGKSGGIDLSREVQVNASDLIEALRLIEAAVE